MFRVECNISLENVSIVNDKVTCDSQTETSSGFIAVRGNTTSNGISVSNSNIVVQLEEVSIQSQSPFTSVSSMVWILFAGENLLVAARV